MLSLSTCFKRLIITSSQRNLSTTSIQFFKTSPCLMGEPLKKKRRLDPAIIRAREERRKKKLEKQIRKLEKSAKQLKPIEECEVPLSLLDEKKHRMRNLPALTDEVLENRVRLEKLWANYKREQHLADVQMIDRFVYSQQRALDELRKESEELYQEAIQMDHRLIPFKTKGTVSTPPIKGYASPDGEYIDVSKNWDN